MKPLELKTDAERLLIAMRRTGLTNWQVAQKAGIAPPEISQFLSNVRTPSRAVCNALADAVELGVKVLFPDTLKHHDDKEAAAYKEAMR